MHPTTTSAAAHAAASHAAAAAIRGDSLAHQSPSLPLLTSRGSRVRVAGVMFDIVCVTSLPADYIEIDSISVRSDPHMQGLRLRAATCERLPAGKGLLSPSDAF